MKAPMDDVMAAYGGRNDVLLEAHIGGGPPNWTAYPTKEAPLLEVTSGHGAFEWVLQRALRHGYHPAVIGSSDVHLPTLGAPMAAHCFRGRFNHELNIRDSGFGSGQVAGVYAAACERQSIWQAIHDRRTFATTGARIILDVSANGESAGSITESSEPVVINIRAHACAPVERVDLIRGDRCLASWLPDTLDVTLDHTDAQPLREGLTTCACAKPTVNLLGARRFGSPAPTAAIHPTQTCRFGTPTSRLNWRKCAPTPPSSTNPRS